MKTVRQIRCAVSDYAPMKKYLTKHKYKFDVKFDATTDEFEFTYIVDEDYYLAVISDLNDMRNDYKDNAEYFGSINTAISAIKTLMDMGVIK